MTKRFAHIQRLVILRKQVADNPTESDRIIRRTIVDSLPDGYRKVYDWIGSCYYPVTSRSIARSWELGLTHASSILNELWQFGLLKRTEYTDEDGKGYKYQVKE